MTKVISLLFLYCLIQFNECCLNSQSSTKSSTPTLSLGSITINKRDNVVYHTYSSDSSTGIEVDSHIIELPTKLVIYDAQFQIPNAKEVLKYAESLGKPIERVIISHSHPDHWFGLDVFKNLTKICALSETIEEIKQIGQAIIDADLPQFGEKIPKEPTIPDTIIKEGNEIIDGVLFQYVKRTKAESANVLIVKMPFQKTILVGDYVFNKVHLFLGEKNFVNWINELRYFQLDASSFNLILLGHTKPADFNAVQENIQYLESARTTLTKSAKFDDFKAEMIRLYPQFTSPYVLDLAKKSLYPSEA